MTPTTPQPDNNDDDKTSITFTAMEFCAPGPVLRLRTAPFPARWLRILREQWYADPARRNRKLPTYSLIEMVSSLDADILAIGRDLEAPRWICAHHDVDDDVLLAAVAAWAATAITPKQPGLDWEALLAGTPLEWDNDDITLAEWDTHRNGTAKLAAHTYQLLPAYLAGLVVDHGLTIQGKHRTFVLGPLDSNGERSAVSWPPERMPDKATGDALWSYKITFQVETIPGHPVPRIHAELSVVRFAYLPVRYVPGKPKRVTLWMHAGTGFLRSRERPTLLAATAMRRHVDGQWRWAWDAGLSRALAHLTTRTFPDTDHVLADPARYEDPRDKRREQDPITTLVLYRTGMKMQRPEPDTPAKDGEDKRKSKTVTHAAGVGFQPIDHMDVHEQLETLLAPTGLRTTPTLARATSKTVTRRLPRHQPPDQDYRLELWHQPGATQQGILTALTHPYGLGLTPVPSEDENTLRFTGDYTLTVTSHTVGALASGIRAPQPSDDDPRSEAAVRAAREERLGDILDTLPARSQRVAAIVEIDEPVMFARLNQHDPYPTIKTGYAKAGRLPQCLHPIQAQPPAADDEQARKLADGTSFLKGDVKRAAAAVLDSLRQVGRSTMLPPPPGIAGPCELTGVWLERHAGLWVPMIVRATTTGEIRAQLVDVGDIPYADLPAALVAGHGRLDRDYATSCEQLAQFLVGAINPRATHDRIVLVRSANLRNRGWGWLQDQHIARDELLLPGVDPADATAIPFKPGDLPGLRIVRLRERTTGSEVPRAFVSYMETVVSETDGDAESVEVRKLARISGVFPFSDWVFYGIAPRSDQAQTPINLTKLDPGKPRNATKAGWNPNPLEIIPAFLQPHDEPLHIAEYVQLLRRAHLHTTIATQMPLPLHQAGLADEYLL
ncbi:hypothetical protein Lesp02_02650 [Lentzea sp. NBRC 105346]|uniref:pPIWI_RE module domain-containing protein n=1 Tax=Lentzea sp. NBRC 105346 TaxID=3032205 RepID=UPI0024A11BCD|nr:DUF3962 domain-containing protein [Lentzea sp. NBRC 105346]GLZ28075.1 hypothetical protein Lesp02_02650 [Lentzea sp. NBRC 105346]